MAHFLINTLKMIKYISGKYNSAYAADASKMYKPKQAAKSQARPKRQHANKGAEARGDDASDKSEDDEGGENRMKTMKMTTRNNSRRPILNQ